ncbi:tetratricopeptide repeat protein [Catenulispora subtropica]|uniref:Tetratricopeptide repeat protein n=1 Tax=Catenulispora subtropica TaxID=450798 RepID=A0ABP5ENN9_9ACTN
MFGGVVIERDGAPLPPGPAQQRAVLALLALAGGQPVGRAALLDALWPVEAPPSAWNIVQTQVKRLRAALEPDRPAHRPSALLPSVGDGYALRLGPDAVDVVRFRTLVEASGEPYRRDDHATVWRLLGEALDLWTAEPAADVPQLSGHPWLAALHSVHYAAVARYLDAATALGRGAEVVGLAERTARLHPLDELAQARLIRVYQDAGRRADAFAHFHATRQLLVDQLGVDPGPELTATHQALLLGESAGRGAAVPSSSAPPLRSGVPAQLPADVPDFVGRAPELAILDQLAAKPRSAAAAAGAAASGGPRPTVVVICGPAGVGKTALALRWSHRVADLFPDGCLYIDLQGYGPQRPVAPADAAAGFLAALGIPRSELPREPDDLTARLRTTLAGRRMLILLDNARTPAQVRPLLPGTAGCRTVVTSRSDLAGLVARDGARRVVVEALSDGEATGLLHRLLGARAGDDPESAARLARFCDRLPLALRIAAERVASRPAATLRDLVADFEDHQRRLDTLSVGEDEAAAMRAVFSWSYAALAPEAAQAFRLLGLHPGRDFDAFAVAALTGRSVHAAGHVVDQLIRTFLIRQTGDGRLTTHDLLRAYARELAENQESDTDRSAAIARLLDDLCRTAATAMDEVYPFEKYRRPRPDGLAHPHRTFADTGPGSAAVGAVGAEQWLTAQTDTLLAAAHLAADTGLARHVGFLAATLQRHLTTAGRFREMAELQRLAVRLARESGDEDAERIALADLGMACHRLTRYAEAIEHLQKALVMAVGSGDRLVEAGARQGLGMVHYRLGDLDTALAELESALDVARTTGDRVTEGSALGNIGLIREWRGEFEAALAEYHRALALHRETGFRAAEADALNNIAIVHRQAGRYPEAVAHLEQALAVYREVNDRGGEGAALNNLGLANIFTGDWRRAREHLLAALELHRVLGGPGEGESLNILGLLDLKAGNWQEAIEWAGQALVLGEDSGDLGTQGNAHHTLGESAFALGEFDVALTHHEQDLALGLRTGSKTDQRRARAGIQRCLEAKNAPPGLDQARRSGRQR